MHIQSNESKLSLAFQIDKTNHKQCNDETEMSGNVVYWVCQREI